MQIPATIYRLAVAFWTGGIAIFTFAVTPRIFKSFGRDMAGRIVGAVFPAYFRWGLACGVTAFVCEIILQGWQFVPTLILLLIMIAITAFQAFYIEPHAAALKKEIPSFETTSKNHPLRRKFSRLHAVSATCNLIVFVCGVVLILLF